MRIGISKYKQKYKISKEYKLLLSWVAIMAIIFIYLGFGAIHDIGEIRNSISETYNKSKNDSLRDGNTYQNVSICCVGVYVNDIRDINMKDSKCIVDFYIWFMSNEDHATPNDFQVIDGYFENVEDKDLCNPEINKSNYFKYHVVATIKQNFDARLYPFDTQYVTIKIQDRDCDINSLKYDCDKKNSTISDRLNITGFIISNDDHPLFYTEEMKYNTTFGNTSFGNGSMPIYSQFKCIIPIEREEPKIEFFRLFQGLIFAVLISLIALFIKPTWVDPRFGLGVGALFAAIANNYIVTFSLPSAEYFTLSDVMHGMGIRVIFITLVQSVISLHIYDRLGKKLLSEVFDIMSFTLFSILYLGSIFYIFYIIRDYNDYNIIFEVVRYIIFICIIIILAIFYWLLVRARYRAHLITRSEENDSNK